MWKPLLRKAFKGELSDELYQKLEDPKFSKKYEDIEQYYIKNTVKTKNEYYELFKNRLDTLINL